MKQVVGIFTPTRNDERLVFRPLYDRMVAHQTVQPDFQYVIDYPPVSDELDLKQRLIAGVAQAQADGVTRLIVMEDDDYYPPTYIESILHVWRPGTSVVGIANSLYYHLPAGWWMQIQHGTRASLHSMSFDPSVLSRFPFDSIGATHLDAQIWMWCTQMAHTTQLLDWSARIISMKHGLGLCGGDGHHKAFPKYNMRDANRDWLRLFVGEEFAQLYLNLEVDFVLTPCAELQEVL